MKQLNNLLLGVILTLPVVAMANTTTDLNSPVIAQGVAANNITGGTNVAIGGTGTSIMKYGNTQDATFTFNKDTWIVNVGAGESAKVDFSVISNITPFTVNQTQSDFSTIIGSGLSYSGLLGTGQYFFTAIGSIASETVGKYSVTTAVSAVPVPAAVWLMGTAMLGLVSFGKRKK